MDAEQQLTEEKKQKIKELIEEEEGISRKLKGFWQHLITAIAVAMSLFAIYSTVFPVTTQLLRGFNAMSRELEESKAALVRAARLAAWQDVARRLAHEIKNPLTPIQLSAERIARKLGGRLEPADAEFLARATQTIVNQVAAMKGMVDAFAGYARMPRAKLEALDLNALVHEVLALYDARTLGLQLHLDADLPRIAGDSTLLRQVIHNLLQNAQDALADHPAPSVEITTHLNNNAVYLTVTDNGAGFPEHLMTRLFEPYATTKTKGTGLGLAIVKKIVEEHQGRIQIENIKTGGASIRIALPVFAAAGEHT